MHLVFYLPILTIIITCGTTNGVEQTCETRCISDCEASCPDAKVCSDNEVDCGEGPPHPSGFCDADRVCVAKNCECRFKFLNPFSYHFLIRYYNEYLITLNTVEGYVL